MTGKAFQSKARAHASFVFEQRKKGKTWQEIVDELAKRDCVITLSALRKWSIRYIKRPDPADQKALMEKEALQPTIPPRATPTMASFTSQIPESIPNVDNLLTTQSAQKEQTPWSVITPKH
ncbi:MAG: hypothetical protein A3F67_03530 [Verrucomicrobia bacterium RIFCSPHIGHO2_12_FULL_41_10]|nr:MAG: hypothetical protein A3F67_03530 [Verrucomicrobia bacterium RIFCSPHIGHO2_12_FULL_41_10]